MTDIIKDKYRLMQGDCLEVMDKLIKEGIKVDAIICDPPYGTTACKWDTVIPFDDMWERLNKLIKPNGAIVLFGNEPFTSKLMKGNSSCVHMQQIKEIFKRNNMVVVEFGDKYLVFKVEQH